ncbi:hypothetical protein JHK87_041874 [Glycine soja]|nr:hypothetical protein JHK87_041874 [Glycine soja]
MNRDKGNKEHVIFRPRQIPHNGLVIVGGGPATMSRKEVEELAELVVVGLELDLDELEDEGAACANVVAAWEEISADEGFEDAGFVTALAVDDNNLGEVDGGLTSDAGKDVLKAIHQGDHARTKRSSSSRCFCRRRDLVRHDRWIEP